MENNSYPYKQTFLNYISTHTVAEGAHYEEAYDKIFIEDKRVCWNFGAAFFLFNWLVFRRMYLYSIVALWLGMGLECWAFSLPENWMTVLFLFVSSFIFIIIFGCFGTKVYFRWTSKNIKKGLAPKAYKVDWISALLVFPVAELISYFLMQLNYFISLSVVLETTALHEILSVILITIYLLIRHFLYYKQTKDKI